MSTWPVSRRITRNLRLVLVLAALTPAPSASADERTTEPDVLSDSGRKKLHDQLGQLVEKLTEQIKRTPDSVELHSSRGDAHFFRSDFPAAVADYQQMLKLQPDLDAKHWRLGLAWFYVGKYADAAQQFEKYYQTDDVDRENGLWWFLSQAKEQGFEKARRQMLKYEKPDRGGLGDVYRMYAGELTADKILAGIRAAKVNEAERNQRLFYAELYIGLFESVQNRHAAAEKHLKAAVDNPWPRKAGYGPNYMWHVARLHCLRARAEAKRGN